MDYGYEKIVMGQMLERAGIGGAEIYAALLAEEHVKHGGEACVIILGEEGPLDQRVASGVTCVHLDYRRETIRRPWSFIRSLWHGYRRISHTIAEQRITVLQTHLPSTNLWGLVMSLRGKCKVAITIHNNVFLPRKGTFIGNKVRHLAYRMMIRRCAAVICVSANVRRSVRRTLGLSAAESERIHVVTNGVPIPDPLSEQRRLLVRRKYSVPADAVWIIAAGRLTDAKNPICLLEAAARLRDLDRDWRLTWAGEGVLRPVVEQKIAELDLADRVSFPGNIDDLGDVMAASDLLAMPSRWEGIPLVLLEALARGLPVVGTRIPGIVDVVTPGEQGLLVGSDDVTGLAEALAALIQDEELRRTMAEKAGHLARERYDFARVYEQLIAIYRSVLGGA